MKSKAFLILTFFFQNWALAFNPQEHFCRISGGSFGTIRNSNDQFGICKFGSSSIDSLSYLSKVTQSKTSSAVNALKDFKTCTQANGSLLYFSEVNQLNSGTSEIFCYFTDGSFVTNHSLTGQLDSQNQDLIRSLELKY